MKKFFLPLLSLFLLLSCVNKETLKEEIIKEVKEELLQANEDNATIKKGEGSFFYNEVVSIGDKEYYVHHSTLECPAINNGVQLNCYKKYGYNNLFCSKCMDFFLILKFENEYFPNGYNKN